jgi:hypothetical protein
VTALGTTHCPETHGVELRERAGSGKQLDESAFVDLYVRMIFATDKDEDEDADADAEEGEGEGSLSIAEDRAGGARVGAEPAGDGARHDVLPRDARRGASGACGVWQAAGRVGVCRLVRADDLRDGQGRGRGRGRGRGGG